MACVTAVSVPVAVRPDCEVLPVGPGLEAFGVGGFDERAAHERWHPYDERAVADVTGRR